MTPGRGAPSCPPPENNFGMAKVVEGGDIKCYALDPFLKDLDVGLIKIDVEGAEVNVLRSAAETIRRCRPVIITEAPTEEEFEAIRAVLPAHYAPSKRYNATPTYIWIP